MVGPIAEEPVQGEPMQSEPAGEPPRRRWWLWVIVALVVLVAIVLLLLLLRGCSPSGSGANGASTQSPGSSSSASTVNLENRVYAALHARHLPNGDPLDTLVYIVHVPTANGATVIITLNVTAADLARGAGPSARQVADMCVGAATAAIPQATSITVVDGRGAVAATVKR